MVLFLFVIIFQYLDFSFLFQVSKEPVKLKNNELATFGNVCNLIYAPKNKKDNIRTLCAKRC